MKTILGITQWLSTLLLPFLLIMTAVIILFNPWFLVLEYSRPGFPADPYGFTKTERLQFGGVSLEYMHNKSGIEFLAKPTLSDGTPLYNERELSHMEDVKGVFQGMIFAWWIILVVIILTGLWSWRKHAFASFWQRMSTGGWAAIVMVAAILVGVVVAFDELFTLFHKLFFTGDTWLFAYSDSLIRLFPLEFWMDAFIWMGGITILLGLLFAFGGRWMARQ
jgi:integral membrane protein (TIGR01906 family)